MFDDIISLHIRKLLKNPESAQSVRDKAIVMLIQHYDRVLSDIDTFYHVAIGLTYNVDTYHSIGPLPPYAIFLIAHIIKITRKELSYSSIKSREVSSFITESLKYYKCYYRPQDVDDILLEDYRTELDKLLTKLDKDAIIIMKQYYQDNLDTMSRLLEKFSVSEEV